MAKDEELLRQLGSLRATQYEAQVSTHAETMLKENDALAMPKPRQLLLSRAEAIRVRMVELAPQQDKRVRQERASPVMRWLRWGSTQILPEVTIEPSSNSRTVTVASRLLLAHEDIRPEGTAVTGWQLQIFGRTSRHPAKPARPIDWSKTDITSSTVRIYRVSKDVKKDLEVSSLEYGLDTVRKELWILEDTAGTTLAHVRADEDLPVEATPSALKAQEEIGIILGAAEADLGIAH